MNDVTIKKTTPLLVVEAIEPCLDHFCARLGYTLGPQVPHGERLGFVILAKGDVELMLQTFASAADDLPALVPLLRARPMALYHDVDDLEAVARALPAASILVGPRTTNYGAREIFATDPAGFIHGYAQHA
jgi:hypothetical protein